MKLYNINVDEQAVAQGLLDIMSEHDKAILGLGMINKPVMDILEKQLKEKFDDLVTRDYGELSEVLRAEADKAGKDFVRKVSKEITTALYRAADEQGLMVV